jgi:transposase InsO family protein
MAHANARLTVFARLHIVDLRRQGYAPAWIAEVTGVSRATVYKWLARYAAEGRSGLVDRTSRPQRIARRTSPATVAAVCELRRQRAWGPHRIAYALGIARSTVYAILRRLGLHRLAWLHRSTREVIRYERAAPGELVHLDVKKLGRIEGGAGKRAFGDRRRRFRATYTDRDGHVRSRVGWEYVHVAVDDHSRLAYAEVLADEKAATAAGFLQRALAFYRRHGIKVERVLTDNGSCYRATLHALACRQLGVRHLRTRPYRPQTNGKAERFIRTLLDGWAYNALYKSSRERTNALDGWLWHYNHRRRHSALGHQPPVSRTNLLGSYI